MATSISRNGNSIEIQADSGTFQITYSFMKGGILVDNTEYGFYLTNQEGDALGRTLTAEQLEQAETVASQVIAENFDEISGHMKDIMADRIQNTDKDPDDAVTTRNLNSILWGNRPRAQDMNDILDAMATRATFDAVEELGTDSKEVETWWGISSEEQADANNILLEDKNGFMKFKDANMDMANTVLFETGMLPLRDTPEYLQKQNHITNMRDWLNENREAINALIPDDLKASFEIPAELPNGDIALNTPAFTKAYTSVTTIYTNMAADDRLDEFPAGFTEVAAPLAPASPLIMAYSDIYALLGNDADIPADPVEVMKGYDILTFKSELQALDKSGLLGDLPDFDITKDPFDPAEQDFIKTWAATTQILAANGLTPDGISAQSDAFLRQILDNPQVTDEAKQQIQSLSTPLERIGFVLQNGLLPPEASAVMGSAMKIGMMAYSLPEDVQTKIGAAVTPLQAAANSAQNQNPDNSNTTGQPDNSAQTTRDEPPAEAEVETETRPPRVYEDFGTTYYLKVRDVEEVFFGEPDEGYYDIKEQDAVSSYLENKFENYIENHAESFQGDFTFVQIDPDSAEPKVFAIRKDGNIYNVKRDEDGTLEATGSKLGNFKDGGDTPHEATVVLLGQLLEAQKLALTTEKDEHDQKIGELNREQHTLIRDELSTLGLLEDKNELESALRSHSQDIDTFKESEIHKKLRSASANPAEFDAFIISIVGLENQKKSLTYVPDSALQTDVNQLGAIHDLFGFFRGGSYNPEWQNNLHDTVNIQDNILNIDAYDVLQHMEAGDTIYVDVLYDQDNPQQMDDIKRHFEGRDVVTREEVFAYVQEKMDATAINTLKNEDENILGMSDERKHEILRGVTQAMADGRFNPYERDVQLAFKAFERPDLTNPSVQNVIDSVRANGEYPTGDYAIRNMSDEGLASLTQYISGYDSMSRTEQKEALSNLFKYDIPGRNPEGLAAELLENPHYKRIVQNYYDNSMANYTWFRAGEVDDTSTNTWNGRYGALGMDERMYMFLRYNRGHLDEVFAQDDPVDLFLGGSQQGQINPNLKYEDVMAKLSPSGQDALKQGIEDLHRPSGYIYFMELRLDHYRNLRNDEYVARMRDKVLTEEYDKAAADRQPDEETEPRPDGPDQDETELDPDGPDQDETELDPDGQELEIGDEYEINAQEHQSDPLTVKTGAALWPAVGNKVANHFNQASPIPKTVDIDGKPISPDKGPNFVDPEGKPLNAGDPPRFVSGVDGDPPKKVSDLPDFASSADDSPLKPSTPPEMKHADGRPLTPGETPKVVDNINNTPISAEKPPGFVDSQGNPLSSDRPPELISGADGKPLHAGDEPRIMSSVDGQTIKPEDPVKFVDSKGQPLSTQQTSTPTLDKLPEIEAPSALSKIFEKSGKLLKGAGKVVGGLSKPIAGAGIAIGAGIAGSEVYALAGNQDFLKATNLIPEDTSTTLSAIYAAHVTQASVDPSLIGGEFATRELINNFIEENNIDPATAKLIRPDFLIGDGENGIDPEEFKDMYEKLSGEGLDTRRYTIAENHELPREYKVSVDGKEIAIPLGQAILNEDILEEIKGQYTSETQQTGIQYLQALNELAASAKYIMEEAKDDNPRLGKLEKALKENAADLTQVMEDSRTPEQDYTIPLSP